MVQPLNFLTANANGGLKVLDNQIIK
jgi:hypothetical protein